MMNAKTFVKNLPILLKDRGLLIVAVVCVVFGVGLTFATGKLFVDYSAAQEIQKQILTMEEYLQKFEEKQNRVEREKFRPIESKELENVQAEILLAVQGNNLKMEGLRSIKDDDKIESSEPKSDAEEVVNNAEKKRRKNISLNKAYELTISGSYDDTMKFLYNFHAGKALIKMRALNIMPENEGYKTKMNYKIYVK